MVIEVESRYNNNSSDVYWDDMFVYGNVVKKWPEWASGSRRKIDDRNAVFNFRKRVDTIGDVIE